MFSEVGEVSITNSRLKENAARRVVWTFPWFHVRYFDEIKMQSPSFTYGKQPLRFQLLKTSYMEFIKIYLVLERTVPSDFLYRVRLDVIAYEDYCDDGTLVHSTKADLMMSEFSTTVDFVYASRISIFGLITKQPNQEDSHTTGTEETSKETEETGSEDEAVIPNTKADSTGSEEDTGSTETGGDADGESTETGEDADGERSHTGPDEEVGRSDTESHEDVGLSETGSTKAIGISETGSDEEVNRSEIGREEVLKSKSAARLIEDLKEVLRSGKGSDVVLKVQDKEFVAHRSILGMRSPVFAAMFKHDMVEQKSGVVDIEDCDSDTFPDFLYYVYVGKVENLTSEIAPPLYRTADKYELLELKEECLQHMKNNISVETFCDILILSVQHDERELTRLAVDFFLTRAADIVLSLKWQMFLMENPLMGNELFIRLTRDSTRP